ncbi:hypothetical protein GCM10022296_00830 [Secundilactobacillus similis DSM 23365 = JCM 2765]|uniref:Uncharacterized protein n=1 Tax=Secundilactobacillus similis DSM 23365 = JCM 2765 TaxID=1423804 RepID=A0A0R2EGK5_9LACO|nr:hypothetical protein FD14_GL002879 [Secundilactobacillus similis DSM 23365 = JCM 2765]
MLFFVVVCVQHKCAEFVKFGFVGALIMGNIVGTTGRSENLGWNAVGTILSRKNTSQNSAFH